MYADKLNGYFRMISTFILFVMRPAAAVAITKYMYQLLAIQIKCRGHYVYRRIPCIINYLTHLHLLLWRSTMFQRNKEITETANICMMKFHLGNRLIYSYCRTIPDPLRLGDVCSTQHTLCLYTKYHYIHTWAHMLMYEYVVSLNQINVQTENCDEWIRQQEMMVVVVAAVRANLHNSQLVSW
jgi:hypothetical protein